MLKEHLEEPKSVYDGHLRWCLPFLLSSRSIRGWGGGCLLALSVLSKQIHVEAGQTSEGPLSAFLTGSWRKRKRERPV